MTPYVDNALGFRTPYKVEKWDGSAWVDITDDATWGYLTDGKPSTAINAINFSYTTDASKIRLYYDFGKKWVTPASQLVIYRQHLHYIDYLKVEQADDSVFTTNVGTLKEITSRIEAGGDGTTIVPTSTFWRRYLRIQLDVSRPAGSTWMLELREIAYYSPAHWSGSKLISSMIPIDWDYNKNVFFTGNVGIGTTSPTQGKLVVNGTIDVMNHKITSLATPTADADAATKGYVDSAITSGDNDWAGVGGNPTLTGKIYHTGNVGIGTTDPEAKLDVKGDTIRFQMADGGAHTWFPFTNGEVYITSDLDKSGNGDIHFRTFSDADSYQEKMVVEGNTGNVGINVTNPAAKLDVSGDFRATSGFIVIPIYRNHGTD